MARSLSLRLLAAFLVAAPVAAISDPLPSPVATQGTISSITTCFLTNLASDPAPVPFGQAGVPTVFVITVSAPAHSDAHFILWTHGRPNGLSDEDGQMLDLARTAMENGWTVSNFTFSETIAPNGAPFPPPPFAVCGVTDGVLFDGFSVSRK